MTTYCLPYPASAPCSLGGTTGTCTVASSPGAAMCSVDNMGPSSMADAQTLAGAFVTVLAVALLFRFLVRFFLNTRG